MLLFSFTILLLCVSTVYGWKTYSVPHIPGQDDTPALSAALPNLATNSTILFQKGITYNIFTPLKFPALNNVEVRIEGNLTYPTDIAIIQGTHLRTPNYDCKLSLNIIRSFRNCWVLSKFSQNVQYTLF